MSSEVEKPLLRLLFMAQCRPEPGGGAEVGALGWALPLLLTFSSVPAEKGR